MTKLAWCVQNDKGDLLAYTCQSSAEQCIDYVEDKWGVDLWNRLAALGSRIVMVELTHIPQQTDELSSEEFERIFRPHGRIR